MSYTLTTRVADRVLARSIMHPGPHVTVVTDASSKLCPGFSGPTCVWAPAAESFQGMHDQWERARKNMVVVSWRRKSTRMHVAPVSFPLSSHTHTQKKMYFL